jgi:uncharacterized protein (DUF2147 family)
MRRSILFSLLFVINSLFSVGALAQYEDVTGLWKTIDDDTGKQKSTVEIYINNGKLFGKIVDLADKTKKNDLCTKCAEDDSRYNKKILGMTIITDMEVNDKGVWTGGQILDPANGKTYRCEIWLDGDTLKVRGYIAFFFRTQEWLR